MHTNQWKDLPEALIRIPSFSGEEENTAALLESWLREQGCWPRRKGNNVWAVNEHYRPEKPTILLNSHHDTVKPNPAYTRDPFEAKVEDGKLYGLGSNDAGGALACLAATFVHYSRRTDLPFNLVFLASAEEENSGPGGVELVWPELPPVSFAIVGEPTLCQLAVAEKGLLVLDCIARGQAGHAARDEGINALYLAIDDINWFRNYRFDKQSEQLGAVKMTVTAISAGKQHNVVPAECHFTVDVRVTDAYTLEEVLTTIQENVKCEVKARSMRMRPSGIDLNHPLVEAARTLGLSLYGSPTTSDQALIPVPSVKCGPGDSARSHTADEFIYLHELEQGFKTYTGLLDQFIQP